MKTTIKFLFTLLILFAFSCTQESTQDPLPPDLDGVSAKTNSKATLYYSEDIDESGVEGSATLHRNKDGITINVKTSELTPGYAYTLWIIPFNKPEDCARILDPANPVLSLACRSDELLPFTDGYGDVIYGAGHVVGGSGKGNFSAHLNNGDIGRFGNGLIDAQGAEVHIVVRCHGPADPGRISEQIHTFEVGCEVCADVWFGIFLP